MREQTLCHGCTFLWFLFRNLSDAALLHPTVKFSTSCQGDQEECKRSAAIWERRSFICRPRFVLIGSDYLHLTICRNVVFNPLFELEADAPAVAPPTVLYHNTVNSGQAKCLRAVIRPILIHTPEGGGGGH